MNLLNVILLGWGAMIILMALLWLIQRRTQNAGIVDVAWSFGTGLMGVWFATMATDGGVARRIVVASLAGIWGARLGFYLVKRMLAEDEDGRYRMLREQWGESTQRKLFLFFQLQAMWAVLFALPMLVASLDPTPGLVWTDYLGIFIWMLAIGGESLADHQLARFKADPASNGRVCTRGLWRYSRHPNYFFEWVHWWSYVAIGATWTWGWLTLFGPAVMLWFLLKVTGVPMTERRAIESRGEAYRRYQQTTNAFFPGPRRGDVAT